MGVNARLEAWVNHLRLLITGGLGFIGSNFIRCLIKKHPSYYITNLDALTYAGNPANLKNIENHPNYTFIKGDIANENDVKEAMKEVDAVVNFAAETHVDRSITDPENFVRTNFTGTYVLLEYARKYDVERFLQISSDEVYGSIENGSCKETDALTPSSPYSASKAGADLLAKAYYDTYGLPVLITRSSNNFGSYQFPEKLVPLFTIKALSNQPLPLYGDGLNVRDWIYVKDNCTAISMVFQKGKVGEIYNIAAGNEKTNLEVTRFILKELGKPESLIHYVKDRPGHDRRYSLDTTKIRSLGWKPAHNFEEEMRKTIAWYLQNEWWWKPLMKQS